MSRRLREPRTREPGFARTTVRGRPHQIFFETLGNKTRWDIVHLLQKGPRRSTDIAEKLGYEQSLISHHLRRLETCGFVSFKQNGNERMYSLNKKTVGPLLKLMDKHINTFCKYCAYGK